MKPIGYHLRQVHELLEAAFADALRAESLTRRHWQVLNTIALGARTAEEVDERLAPFVAEDGSMGPILADLRTRGWLTENLALTEAGHQAHADVSAAVDHIRTRITDGISAEQYASAVRTLERMAANLEAVRNTGDRAGVVYPSS